MGELMVMWLRLKHVCPFLSDFIPTAAHLLGLHLLGSSRNPSSDDGHNAGQPRECECRKWETGSDEAATKKESGCGRLRRGGMAR